LQAVILVEGLLHRMELTVLRQALDGDHLGTRRLHGEHGAGFHRDAVDMDDAGAALRGIAADMGAGQLQALAQEVDEQRAVLDGGRHVPAVHLHRDVGHPLFPS